MNHKQKYEAIPRGYQKDVLTLVGCNRMGITRFFSDNPNYHTSDERELEFKNAINTIWKPHNLVKQIDVILGIKVTVDHPTATEYIEYCELTSFKIQLTGTLGEYENINDAMSNSEKDIREMKQYPLHLLIAKYILR